MPDTRILYTLNDVIKLIAKEEGVDFSKVSTFEQNSLEFDGNNNFGNPVPIEDGSYIFQVDK